MVTSLLQYTDIVCPKLVFPYLMIWWGLMSSLYGEDEALGTNGSDI